MHARLHMCGKSCNFVVAFVNTNIQNTKNHEKIYFQSCHDSFCSSYAAC